MFRGSLLLTVFVLVIVVVTAYTHDDTPKKKLQIGIKKKVENCVLKSKKGDSLSM
jgi:FK506-binding protein 2